MARPSGQISIEYLILVGFLVFVIIAILGVGFVYSAQLQDRLRTHQLATFAEKLVQSAESVYYAGAPSRVTIPVYLPSGVTGIEIYSSEIIFNITTSSGVNRRSFSSNVPLTGTLVPFEGVRRIQIRALADPFHVVEVVPQ